MCERPLITCFIVTYNNFKAVYGALDSILQQTYPRIELAIFDDCSEHFPEKEIKTYICDHKRENIENVIIHRNLKNQGTVKNLNAVIQCTHGKYLLDIGTDDSFFNEQVCKKVVDIFERTGAYAVTCYKEVIDSSGKRIAITPRKRNAERMKHASTEELYKMVAMGIAIAGIGTFYARKVFDEIGGFDETYRLQEDGPFFLKMLRSGYRIQFTDLLAVKYKLGDGVSSSRELNPDLKKDMNTMMQKEVLPYLDKFKFWERRRIYYQLERFKHSKQLGKKEKLYFVLKYPDVVIYRRFMAV